MLLWSEVAKEARQRTADSRGKSVGLVECVLIDVVLIDVVLVESYVELRANLGGRAARRIEKPGEVGVRVPLKALRNVGCDRDACSP
jgi:hypothetical protein